MHAHDFPRVGIDPRWRMFVWTHASRGWSPDGESRGTVAIGSPFLYLERAARAAGWEASGMGPTLWIPFHGTRLLRVRGDHVALAQDAFDREGPCTVCLHVEDAADPEIVAAWAAPGHHLVTAGRRNDPDFLARILELIGSARRVASNRLSTAIMYAAAAGKEVAVYGPPLTLSGGEAHTVEQIQDIWPEFHGEKTSTVETMAIAADELGAAALLPAAELRTTLGWDRRVGARAAIYYWLPSPMRKAATVMGLARRLDVPAFEVPVVSPWAFLRHPRSHLPSPLPRRVPPVPELAAPLPVLFPERSLL
ncbi:MAG TPA: hypothetical protein VGN28_15750 [Blastococcus sp.]|nr:hypothetical protein [Blastococcus sp.]